MKSKDEKAFESIDGWGDDGGGTFIRWAVVVGSIGFLIAIGSMIAELV